MFEKKPQQQTTDSFVEQIASWKQQHGDVIEIQAEESGDPELDDLTIFCKKPGRTELSRFIKDAASGDALKAQNNFFFGCLLYPAPDVVKAIVDKKPGLIVALGNELQSLTGINQSFFMKKL